MNRLYNQFTYYDNFTLFSTSAWIENGIQNADSAESIHDVIHNNVGQGGSMTYLEFSAYDPIFWLHHTMMDRILALWQELHPESYVQPRVTGMGSYTIPVGMTADANTRKSTARLRRTVANASSSACSVPQKQQR